MDGSFAGGASSGGVGVGRDGGGFELLYDEAIELDAERARKEAAGETSRGRGVKGSASQAAGRAGRNGPSWI